MANDNNITIGNQSYSFREENLLQSTLKFYPENPRIYSLLVIDEVIPEQKEIENQLTDMEHVKTLRQSIEANGGLIDPLIVRDGDFVVLEGNSRLAAYRLLAKKDPIKWSMVKCRLLPADISDDAVFTLLGQYHIVGRQDWSPFEQAGYLWRRINNNDILPEVLAKEMGLSITKTKKSVAVYDFMIDHDAVDSQKWSYYEEYHKSKSIKEARAVYSDLDKTIVSLIKTGEISQAIDIRNKLEPVTKIYSEKKRKKVLKELISGEATLEECYEKAELSGVNTNLLNNLITVKNKLNAMEELKHISSLSTEDLNKCKFEIKKISLRMKELEKRFHL